jgi:hypothetical protein
VAIGAVQYWVANVVSAAVPAGKLLFAHPASMVTPADGTARAVVAYDGAVATKVAAVLTVTDALLF